MLTKPPCWVLIIEILICFIPITLLWVFGVLMLLAFIFDGWGLDIWMIPAFILLFLGGLGLIGFYQIMVHIYRFDYVQAENAVYRKLYAGITSLGSLSIGAIIINPATINIVYAA
jgi:hypothetical protein